ncbi:MAG: hypothetical protein AB9819_05260 [Methanomassiliicoccales archaeon]
MALVVLACVLWIKKGKTIDIDTITKGKIIIFKQLSILFFISLTAAIYFFGSNQSDHNITSICVAVAFLYTIIGTQIFHSVYKSQIIIFEILLSSVYLIWVLIDSSPSSLVGIDTWWHREFVQLILENGVIPLNNLYSTVPAFHLLVGTSMDILSLNYKISAFLSIGVITSIISVLTTIIISKMLNLKDHVSLLACIIVTTGTIPILLNCLSIPNTMAASLMLLLIILIFKYKTQSSKLFLLILLLMFSIIFTHIFTSMVILIFLSYLTLDANIIKNKNLIDGVNKLNSLTILFIILCLFWWVYSSNMVFTDLIELLLRSLGFKQEAYLPEGVGFQNNRIGFSESLLRQMGVFTLMSISLIGILYLSVDKYSINRRNYRNLSIIALSFGGLAFILNFGDISSRWWYFSQIILSIPIGIGITYIILSTNKTKLRYLYTIIVIFIIVFLSVISPIANMQYSEDIFPNSSYRYSLTTSELIAPMMLGDHSTEIMYSDDYYAARLFTIGYNAKGISSSFVENKLNNSFELILIRQAIIDETIVYNKIPIKINLNISTYVYNNENICIYNSQSTICSYNQ